MGEYFFWYQHTQVVPDKGPLNGVCSFFFRSVRKHSIDNIYDMTEYFFTYINHNLSLKRVCLTGLLFVVTADWTNSPKTERLQIIGAGFL